MRCLALAQAWQQDGGRVTFLSQCDSRPLRERICAAGADLLPIEAAHPHPADLACSLALRAENPGAWWMLDGYHFDTAYQHSLRQAGARLLVMDDHVHLQSYEADWLLNQNIHAGQMVYPINPEAGLLLGTRYALLRPEFRAAGRPLNKDPQSPVRRVMVTLGGSDPDNVTLKVLQALALLKSSLQVKVVVGPANPHRALLAQTAQASPQQVELLEGADMPALMIWADLAISAGGSTNWELAYMGLPALVITLADNQQALAAELGRQGSVLAAGWHADLTPACLAGLLEKLMDDPAGRLAMIRQAQTLVDGWGAERVCRLLRGEALWLRRAQEDDAHLIWTWANDPLVRAVSFNKDAIPWENHLAWFNKRIYQPTTRYEIAMDEHDQPVGQVRYENEGKSALVSISMSPESRGHGFGSLLLQLSARRVFHAWPVAWIDAYIKPDNAASLRAFRKAGYGEVDPVMMHDEPACHFILKREDVS